MEAMGRDKKARAGAPRFIVLSAPGEAVVRRDVPADAVESVWREIGCA
jgi:3-dehydroquinate synthetase